ncbi:MAG: hypothetical protein IT432_15955 [Phycisphaerales bacterium]|nr:hypothetical protein [Phycisphaerales bacterium]
MAVLLLNSYAPLVASARGREASQEYGIPPFVDGSIRREPDLENPRPSISCICRGDRFAPRLEVGDHVAYMTRKHRYGLTIPQRRLTAIVRVDRLFESHEEGAAWYREQGLSIPSNCIVTGSEPFPVRMSHRIERHRRSDEEDWARRWDAGYRARVRKNGRFVCCEPLWIDLSWNAPQVHEEDLVAVFGAVPGTRNPGAHDLERLLALTDRLKIRVTRPARLS